MSDNPVEVRPEVMQMAALYADTVSVSPMAGGLARIVWGTTVAGVLCPHIAMVCPVSTLVALRDILNIVVQPAGTAPSILAGGLQPPPGEPTN